MSQKEDEKLRKIPPKLGEPEEKKVGDTNGNVVVSIWHGLLMQQRIAESTRQEKQIKKMGTNQS